MAATCALLAACGPGEEGMVSTQAGPAGTLRAEAYCTRDGLAPSLRHTFILLDERAVSAAQTPADFVASNAELRDAVLAIAGPDRALSSGAAAARERFSLGILPADGSAATVLFTGCLPALSEEERQAARQDGSALAEFFTGGAQRALDEARSTYRTRLVASLQRAAADATGAAAPQADPLPETSVVRALEASGRLVSGGAEGALPRLVLVTDLSAAPLPTGPSAYAQGLADGAGTRLDLGRSEVVLVQPTGTPPARDYLDGFLLSVGGDLSYLGGPQVTALTPPPVRVDRYVGEAAYPNRPEAVQLRIAADRDGQLVSSWIVLRGRRDRATPMEGQMICDAQDACEVRSGRDGFAQRWSPSPGGEPEFAADMPFGGMRDFAYEVTGEAIAGRISDPAVGQVGPDPDSDHVPITANVQPNATF